MHFYYAFLAIDFAFGIHGLVPGQQLIRICIYESKEMDINMEILPGILYGF